MKRAAPLALAALVATGSALALDLPQQVEKPLDRPQSEAAPIPPQKPSELAAPLPQPRPDPAGKNVHIDTLRLPPPELGGPPIKPAITAEELACISELKALGAKFEQPPPPQDAAGCEMPYPLSVTRLTAEIAVSPALDVNCATALAAAKFAKDVISPTAQTMLGAPLKALSPVSGYVCRPRNGTQKLSEHAFGNAIDIAAFKLTDENVIAVELAPPASNEKFLRAVRDAACGPFKTVLGPGSDADHAEHFHFDLAQRRNGGTFCQ
ncbi:MAG: extensin family protein [Rhizobiaceae bacterium]|nr:extensin family protein [Rhizobiaceae bacterium]